MKECFKWLELRNIILCYPPSSGLSTASVICNGLLLTVSGLVTITWAQVLSGASAIQSPVGCGLVTSAARLVHELCAEKHPSREKEKECLIITFEMLKLVRKRSNQLT